MPSEREDQSSIAPLHQPNGEIKVPLQGFGDSRDPELLERIPKGGNLIKNGFFQRQCRRIALKRRMNKNPGLVTGHGGNWSSEQSDAVSIRKISPSQFW